MLPHTTLNCSWKHQDRGNLTRLLGTPLLINFKNSLLWLKRSTALLRSKKTCICWRLQIKFDSMVSFKPRIHMFVECFGLKPNIQLRSTIINCDTSIVGASCWVISITFGVRSNKDISNVSRQMIVSKSAVEKVREPKEYCCGRICGDFTREKSNSAAIITAEFTGSHKKFFNGNQTYRVFSRASQVIIEVGFIIRIINAFEDLRTFIFLEFSSLIVTTFVINSLRKTTLTA